METIRLFKKISQVAGATHPMFDIFMRSTELGEEIIDIKMGERTTFRLDDREVTVRFCIPRIVILMRRI